MKNSDAKKEIDNLKSIVKTLLQDLSSFTNGHDILLKLIGNNRVIYDKSGLGFENNKSSDTTITEKNLLYHLTLHVQSLHYFLLSTGVSQML